MRVAILGGTAGLGYGMALRLAGAGDEILIGSRRPERALAAAERIREAVGEGASVAGGANEEVVREADVVVVTVPFPAQAAMYSSIKDGLRPGAVVIDCNVPLASEVGGKPTRVLGVWEGSAAQQAKGILGKAAKLASGFHTIMAGALGAVDRPLEEDVLVCGEPEARKVAEEIVGRIPGARFIDCGPLEAARILESLTALLIGINQRYKLEPGAGIRITGLGP
ncbi:MAG: NADPH-dependent F420 reductase [Actinomycetota bacterium]